MQPTDTPPDPLEKQGGYAELAAAGIDTQEVVLRGATHLEYTYIPLVLPASRLGERFASHYTVAWFDRYLKGDAAAFDRLTATSSTAARTPPRSARATSAPTPRSPIRRTRRPATCRTRSRGCRSADVLSFYYGSAYSLTDPATGAKATCADMRAGCGG